VIKRPPGCALLARAPGSPWVSACVALGVVLAWVGNARAQSLEAAPEAANAANRDVPLQTSLGAGSEDAGAAEAGVDDAAETGTVEDAGALESLDAATRDAGPADAAGVDAAVTATHDAGTTGALDAGPGTTASAPGRRDGAQVAQATGDVVRTLLGLVALLALAWLGGHERVRRLEERIGIAQLMTSGFPFVLLGLVAHAPGVDVLSDATLAQLTPVLQFGLGWIGFHTGFQLDSRAAAAVPRGTATVVILLTALPFLLITALAGAALWGLGLGTDHVMLTRDAVSIGLAGALSAPTLSKLARSSSPRAIELVQTMSLLDDVLVIVAFACLAAWLRPVSHSGWILPGVGWVFVTFGMAAVLGLLTDAVLRGTESRAERSSLLLGVVALTAGMAAMFQIPPLVVCFLAGVLFRNLPGGTDKREIEDAFARLERPIYHLFLIIVGALWRPELATGWLVLPLFLVARTLGRLGGARLARALPPEARPESLAETPDGDLVLPPMGQLAIAFVITAQTLYESTAVRAMVTAVIGGSIVMELVVQVGARRRSSLVPSTRTHRGSDAGDAT
jgi:Kef-type K+ transport system membrane component KefB